MLEQTSAAVPQNAASESNRMNSDYDPITITITGKEAHLLRMFAAHSRGITPEQIIHVVIATEVRDCMDDYQTLLATVADAQRYAATGELPP